MRVEILHEETLTWPGPARAANLALRATPRDDAGQHVLSWRVEVEGGAGARLVRAEDPFGNLVHRVTVDGPVEAVLVRAEGVVSTEETHGLVRGLPERLPPSAFLRPRPATEPTAEVRAFARARAEGDTVLTRLHALLAAVRDEVGHDEAAPGLSAGQVLAAGRGSTRGLAHLYAAGALALDAPARVVLGWVAGQDGLRAWAEAFAPGTGWVAFDPTLGLCATPRHVRLAVDHDAGGLDLGRAVAPGARSPARRASARVTAA